jgi:hypothetical protein
VTKGGEVHLFGKDISLQGAKIDASGLLGGGEVLIGGEFQGKGMTPYASKVIMDEFSEIHTNAQEHGDGGLVVLWSQDHTQFDGKIFAQGGNFTGNGGLVETSSQRKLDVEKGQVNTVAEAGKIGEWLLDPTYMFIRNGDEFTDGYGNCDYTGVDDSGYLSVNRFLNLSSSVTVKAAWGIYIQNSITVTGSSSSVKPSVTFQVCSNLSFLQIGYGSDNDVNITTDGGNVTFTLPFNLVWLKTLHMTITTNGGNVTLPDVGPYNSTTPKLTINAGNTGNVTFSAKNTDGRLGDVTVTAGSVSTSKIDINGTLNMSSAPLMLSTGGSINTNGHDLSLGKVDAVSGSSGSLALYSGSGNTVTVGTVGSTGPLSSLSINSGLVVNLSNVTTTGNISITPSTTLSGSLTSQTGTVVLGSSLTLTGSSTVTGGKGITISAQTTDGDLTLTSSNGPISVTGNVNVHSLTVTNATEASFYDITTAGGKVDIRCPVVFNNGSKTTISTAGGPVTFTSSIHPSVATSDFLINTTAAAINLQALGTEQLPFGTITLTGGDISLNQSIHSGKDLVINNSGKLTLSGGEVWLGGAFQQNGSGSVSLGDSIYAGKAISFVSAVNVTSSTVLQGLGGIVLPSSFTVTGVSSSLTLDAGSYGLTVPSLGSASNPLGALSITASNVILGGDIYSDASIVIKSPVQISRNTTLKSTTTTDGISIIGSMTASSANSSLTLQASSGFIEVSSLGSEESPLGNVTLTGSYIRSGGNITSNASIKLSGTVTLTNSIALTASEDVILDQDVMSSTDPFNFTVSSASGSVSVQNLGSEAYPLGNISLIGAGSLTPKNLISSGTIDLTGDAITFDSQSLVSAAGNVTINNTGILTIPAGTLSVAGNFNQEGSGAVSLGTNIETSSSIGFKGALTITGSTTLKGSKGVSINKSIASGSSAPNLTLDAGSNPITVVFAGDDSNPFGAISIQGSDLTLQGNLYSNTSIVIYPSITISADTVINSMDGYGGLALLKPVTASSETPSLTVYAANALVDVSSLGSDEFPLGNVVLTGSYVTLNGDIVSSEAVEISGAVTITGDLTLIGSSNITLKNQLLPSTNPFDLTLQACDGSVSVQSLGNSVSPLKNVSLVGSNGVTILGTITTTGILTITDEEGTTTCGSGTYPPCNSVN